MKPSTPKGTRDFLPAEVRKREYLFGVIREQFRLFGYAPIETPAMENLSTLTGKYGEEGDQLLFKVLNNGDFLAKADAEALDARDSARAAPSLARRGLRYDLTVPFARYVVQHRNDLQLPFKRSCIAPVWRADRPQKGRYQEFYQCDADVVGSDSLVYEAELVRLFERVYTALGLRVVVRLNHRDVLQGIAEISGVGAEHFTSLITAIDKLDKIGPERVAMDMTNRGVAEADARRAVSLLTETSLERWATLFSASEAGQRGVAALAAVLELVDQLGPSQQVTFDPTLARGLSYYTGCIFEVVVDTEAAGQEEVVMGSIGGGGRYANLTEAFGGRELSGVGISFGAERIYDVLDELDAWPETIATGRQILLAALDEDSLGWAFAKTDELRAAGIAADCYPEAGRPKKPLRYADAEGIPYVALVGTRERDAGTLAVKHLGTGEQEALELRQVVDRLRAEG